MINVIKTDIEGVLIIEPKVFGDARGYFFESFSQRDFDEKVVPVLGHKVNFVQDNEGMSSEGVTSWYDFAKAIAEYAGHTGCDIQPCHSDEFPSPVKRPAYSVLDKTKIKESFGIKIPYWRESLRRCMERMRDCGLSPQ